MPDTEIEILVLGLSESGKSALLKRIKEYRGGKAEVADEIHDSVVFLPPTVGMEYEMLAGVKKGKASWRVREVGSSLRQVWHRFYEHANKVIYVLDMSNIVSLGSATVAFSRLLSEEMLSGKPILLLLNKMDCEYSLSKTEVLTRMRIDWYSSRGSGSRLTIMESSLLFGSIESIVNWMVA
jgi:GTPase SAR1 family protein